jgi:hypothetical protein
MILFLYDWRSEIGFNPCSNGSVGQKHTKLFAELVLILILMETFLKQN